VKNLGAHIVIFPGLDGTGKLTQEFAAGDWKDHETIIMALPVDVPQDYPSLVQWMEERLPEGELVLIGESFSAPLATLLAARLRHRVRALVIVAGFCKSPVPPALGMIPLRPFLLLPPPSPLLKKYLLDAASSPDQVEQLSKAIRSVPGSVLAERAEVVLALQEKDLPRLDDLPVLLLQAKDDKVINWENQSLLERHFPHARVAWIESSHALFFTQPDACRRAVLEFLS
jgi:pimeloyl-[acyl-carrier protein] methyl ester esterase